MDESVHMWYWVRENAALLKVSSACNDGLCKLNWERVVCEEHTSFFWLYDLSICYLLIYLSIYCWCICIMFVYLILHLSIYHPFIYLASYLSIHLPSVHPDQLQGWSARLLKLTFEMSKPPKPDGIQISDSYIYTYIHTYMHTLIHYEKMKPLWYSMSEVIDSNSSPTMKVKTVLFV